MAFIDPNAFFRVTADGRIELHGLSSPYEDLGPFQTINLATEAMNLDTRIEAERVLGTARALGLCPNDNEGLSAFASRVDAACNSTTTAMPPWAPCDDLVVVGPYVGPGGACGN